MGYNSHLRPLNGGSIGLAFLVGLGALLNKLALIECGSQVSGPRDPIESIDGLLDHLSLIAVEPELLSTIDESSYIEFPIAKESKLGQVEKLRSEIFIVGDSVKLNRKKIENKLFQLSKLLNLQQELDQSDLELKKEVDAIYGLSNSVNRSNCYENEGAFLDKLEAMGVKYKVFANVNHYINHIYKSQLIYCKAHMDSLLEESKRRLDRRSTDEVSLFAKHYEKAKAYIIRGDHDPKITLKLKSMNRNVEFRRLVEATSLYLLEKLDSKHLAKSHLANENARVIQAQLSTLDHACSIVRHAFSGLARVHQRLRYLEKQVDLADIPSSPKASQQSSGADPILTPLQLAHACDVAKGIFNMRDSIERAYKLKVLLRKFPAELLVGDNAVAKKKWLNIKLKLYGSDEANKMGPTETLATIRELQRVGFEANLGSNNYFRDISEEVELVDMSYLSELRCLNAFFDKFENIYSKFSQYTVNLEPYLAHYYKLQIDLCNEKFPKLLEEAVESWQIDSTLDPTTLATLDQLTSAFITKEDNKDSRKWIDEEYLRDSKLLDKIIRDYIARSQQDIKSDPMKAFEEMKKACRELDNATLTQLLDFYDRIKNGQPSKKILITDQNSNGFKWLFRARICNHIQFINSSNFSADFNDQQ